jgi:hypothetical protein
MSSYSEQIDQIVVHVGRYGIAASETQLRRVHALAQRYQVQTAISSLLTDASAPDVVRGRAFARVVVGLRSAPVSTPSSTFAA